MQDNVYEVVEQSYDDLTVEDLFYCAPAWCKTYLFRQQFLSLGLESV